MAVVPKRDNLPLEMPDRGWAAAVACDVTGAMRSPPGSDFVMVISVFVILENDDELRCDKAVCNLVQIQQKNTGVTGFLNSQLVTGFTPFYTVMLTHTQLKQGVCEKDISENKKTPLALSSLYGMRVSTCSYCLPMKLCHVLYKKFMSTL